MFTVVTDVDRPNWINDICTLNCRNYEAIVKDLILIIMKNDAILKIKRILIIKCFDGIIKSKNIFL